MEDPATSHRISLCGKDLAVACAKAMTIDGAVNLPSMIAGCARMSGRYLLRSLGLDLSTLAAGHAVLHAATAERTPVLLHLCASIVTQLGTKLASAPTRPLGTLGVPVKDDALATQRTLEPVFAPLQARFALDDEQMARAAAVAAAILVHQSGRHMDADDAFGVAALGFFEGSGTVPHATAV